MNYDVQYTYKGQTRGYGHYILNYFILFDKNKKAILNIDYNKARELNLTMSDLAGLYFSFSIDKNIMSTNDINENKLIIK